MVWRVETDSVSNMLRVSAQIVEIVLINYTEGK